MPLRRRLAAVASVRKFQFQYKFTFLNIWLQGLEQVQSLGVADGLKLFVVRNVNVGAHIVSREAQADNQPPVAENLFLIAKDGIGELRVECR